MKTWPSHNVLQIHKWREEHGLGAGGETLGKFLRAHLSMLGMLAFCKHYGNHTVYCGDWKLGRCLNLVLLLQYGPKRSQ